MKYAYIDIESTGLDTATDRIIDLAVLCVGTHEERSEVRQHYRFDPEIAIPPHTTAIHGITDHHVKGMPKFSEKAREIMDLLEGCALCGFGLSQFDLAILDAEFERARLQWEWLDRAPIIDAGVIFKRKEERSLTAAMKFYCGLEHSGAHSAMADAIATRHVLLAQRARYGLATMEDLTEWSSHGKRADVAGRLAYDEHGVLVFNFGKERGKPCADNLDLVYWMLDRDFPGQTKRFIRRWLEPQEQELKLSPP